MIPGMTSSDTTFNITSFNITSFNIRSFNIMGMSGVHNHAIAVHDTALSTDRVVDGSRRVDVCVHRDAAGNTAEAGTMAVRPQSTALITTSILNHHPTVSITRDLTFGCRANKRGPA